MEKRLIYRSQPFGFDNAMLAGILAQARRNNQKADVTGALICRQDIYLQLIEGPVDRIDRLFTRIEADDRHTNVKLLLEETSAERLFPAWSMLDDESPSLFWSPDEIESGTLETADPDELKAPFVRLRNSIGK
ncbi:BLUF domain-containing protein [Erythrobacter ani]|uniref:BLUF domain-containing protein n=1 Tax=Erythrobacter ani TaxID=2827235 RepID=A0ABS6SNI0_9SPHN|nr:BLUF domain-containing protein [Erythrobacter ani]MBV7266562.1 BLUF domain-containing protein [Erythrobacter ani]